VSDRATILARALLQTIARYIVDDPALQARIAEQLRDEFHEIKQQSISKSVPRTNSASAIAGMNRTRKEPCR
jgi:hypothetical protein